jgi:large subunit ribosomal protein L28
MARRCAVCNKGPRAGISLSHSHIRTKRRFLPNIQKVRIVLAGKTQRANVCTNCLKSGKVVRAA